LSSFVVPILISCVSKLGLLTIACASPQTRRAVQVRAQRADALALITILQSWATLREIMHVSAEPPRPC
jgi:hypothetical protein